MFFEQGSVAASTLFVDRLSGRAGLKSAKVCKLVPCSRVASLCSVELVQYVGWLYRKGMD